MHEEVLIIFILINIPIVLFNKKIVKLININDSADGFRKFHKNSVPLFGGILITYNLFVFTFLDHFVDLNPVQIFFNTREYLSFHFGIMLCIFLGVSKFKQLFSTGTKGKVWLRQRTCCCGPCLARDWDECQLKVRN